MEPPRLFSEESLERRGQTAERLPEGVLSRVPEHQSVLGSSERGRAATCTAETPAHTHCVHKADPLTEVFHKLRSLWSSLCRVSAPSGPLSIILYG